MSDTMNSNASFPAGQVKETTLTYEQKLDQDSRWAMLEGSRHFEQKSAVHETLRRICQRLNELEIPYAVVGGLALFKYGYRRFTEDVDILVTRESLKKIHKELEGRGYRPPFMGSKNLRDAEHQVMIEFLITGDYPGDGKVKEVAFPNPIDVAIEDNNIRYLNLPALVELKIASGLTGHDRLRDLVDVQELIRVLSLPKSFVDNLSPYVQDKFCELWQNVNSGTRRYLKQWRSKLPAIDAKNFDEMIERLAGADNLLKQMLAEGVQAEAASGTATNYFFLVTTDAAIAKKYDMHDEHEFLRDDLDV